MPKRGILAGPASDAAPEKTKFPMFRKPIEEIHEFVLEDDHFQKYLESTPQQAPSTLKDLIENKKKDEVIDEETACFMKPWVKPNIKRGYLVAEKFKKLRQISQYKLLPLEERLEKPEKRIKWIDGSYFPKSRRVNWPGMKMHSISKRLARSDMLQRLEKIRNEDLYRAFYVTVQDLYRKEDEVLEERRAMKREEKLRKRREYIEYRLTHVDRSPLKAALQKIRTLSAGEDVPIDIFELDKLCRKPLLDIKKMPLELQREEKAVRGFIDYLDQSGVSEVLIGTFFMIFSNPGLEENAKELLRLGLGGKPIETANVNEALKDILDTKERIRNLENEMRDLRIKLLRVLKKEEGIEPPQNANDPQPPIRRMDYLTEAFGLKTRPKHLPINLVYDLPEEEYLFEKYNIKLDRHGIGRPTPYSETKGPETRDAFSNTKAWDIAAAFVSKERPATPSVA